MNAIPFALSLIRDHWMKAVWMVIGAVLVYPVASCNGRNIAEAKAAEQVIAASEKVRRAAAQAELAATVADAARRADTVAEVNELKEVVRDVQSTTDVGPSTAAVLAKLREQHARGENRAAR